MLNNIVNLPYGRQTITSATKKLLKIKKSDARTGVWTETRISTE